MRWVFDLDGTICDTEYKLGKDGLEYVKSTPKQDVIDKVNVLYDQGEHITIFTARGSVHVRDWRPETEKQLLDWGVRYTELRFGKPGGEIYVDDRTITPDDLVNRFALYQGLSRKMNWSEK